MLHRLLLFYEQLSQLEVVREVKSMITLNPIKHTTELPLGQVKTT
ncbi:MAG: hypothetical protein ABW168_02795 [Sedimenticola sp.]